MNKVEIIEDLIKEKYELPTLPGIALKILEAVKKGEPSLKELGDILCADPPLTAKVLRMANSSSYGLPGRTTSIPQAINLLGPNIVKSLALSFSLVKNFQNRNKNHFPYTGFWKRSLTVATTSRKITQEVLPPLAEDAFFLGLLHDIGILFLSQCLAKPYSVVLKEKERTGCSYEEAENQILGLNHMEIGGHLVKTWGLPETFHVPIRYHHYPDKSEMEKPEITTLTRVLHLSSLFADFFSYPDKTSSLGSLERYSKEYGLFDNLHVDEAIKQIQRQTTKVFPMFEMKIEAEKHYVEIIESARNELENLSEDLMTNLLGQRRQIEWLTEQVRRDSLTGLYNYQQFHESLEKELHRVKRYNVPLSLIIADIDSFKSINDVNGHLAGDYALKTVAECLKKSFRKSDIIARYGGEEFVIIMPETGPEEASNAAERIREALDSLRIEYQGQELSLTMSFGIAYLTPKEGVCKEEFIRRADSALYQAKNGGKNRCCTFEHIRKVK